MKTIYWIIVYLIGAAFIIGASYIALVLSEQPIQKEYKTETHIVNNPVETVTVINNLTTVNNITTEIYIPAELTVEQIGECIIVSNNQRDAMIDCEWWQ